MTKKCICLILLLVLPTFSSVAEAQCCQMNCFLLQSPSNIEIFSNFKKNFFEGKVNNEIQDFNDNASTVNQNYSYNFISRKHVIENVPYVGQESDIYCSLASLEMVYRFYGLNTSQIEILYILGGAYSLAYQYRLLGLVSLPIIRPPYHFKCHPSFELCQGEADQKFVANLYGCTFECIYPKIIKSHWISWVKYWHNLKYYIERDIPVITSVDPYAWPLICELTNLSSISLFSRGGHDIVVVGFDETNRTICFNDPIAGYFNVSNKGKYQWVSIEEFKRAVRRAFWDLKQNSYVLHIIDRISDPLPKEIVLETVHNRNINKMKGIKSAYDREVVCNNFLNFGIQALDKLKSDFRIWKFTVKLPLYKIINNFTNPSNCFPFEDMISCFSIESRTKYQISTYLFNNLNLSPYCKEDASLLKIESNCWENLTAFTVKLRDTLLNNNIIIAFFRFNEILEKMIDVIEEIIFIQKIIIANNS